MAISSAKHSCSIKVLLTIGVDPRLVKATHGWYRHAMEVDGTRECPLCGGTMHFKEIQAVTQVPGNPSPSTATTREFVCPDCDYFEDADEEG